MAVKEPKVSWTPKLKNKLRDEYFSIDSRSSEKLGRYIQPDSDFFVKKHPKRWGKNCLEPHFL